MSSGWGCESLGGMQGQQLPLHQPDMPSQPGEKQKNPFANSPRKCRALTARAGVGTQHGTKPCAEMGWGAKVMGGKGGWREQGGRGG